ncbi:MAG: hypothetical protein ACTSRK_15140 [Promethearchaeota archaeon]
MILHYPEVDHTNFSFSSWTWPEIETGGSIHIRLLDDGDNLIHSLKISELDSEKQITYINYLSNSFFVSNISAEWFHLEFQITSIISNKNNFLFISHISYIVQ